MCSTTTFPRSLRITSTELVCSYATHSRGTFYVQLFLFLGRTGRAGKKGQSLSLWAKEDWRHAPELVPIMEEASQEIPEWLKDESVR